MTVQEAAGDRAVLSAVPWVLGAGAVVLVPSLVLLFVIFQRNPVPAAAAADEGPGRPGS
ncbi:hypothetical protein ACL02T_24135 [Pseudonocardia sp. RS010]|uniref:hypothetical protein n=1 Tax=Pseudonocardia sp. RS010 TaxID=3385979 RepID=UPI0039A09640